MPTMADILSYRQIIMSAFHFHYQLCLTPERKVEPKTPPHSIRNAVQTPTAATAIWAF